MVGRLLACGLAALCGCTGVLTARRTTGGVRLSSGITVEYECHFDRNAIVDRLHARGWVIALTRSGNLLRFEASTLQPSGERAPPRPITCFGTDGELEIIAGFEDGLITQVDPERFRLKRIGRTTGRPVWLSRRRGELVVVAERPDGYVAHLVVGEREFRIDPPPSFRGGDTAISAFHLDRLFRLWVGHDAGEWGGWCGWLDLTTGRMNVVAANREGVRGFVEGDDGRVAAYGRDLVVERIPPSATFSGQLGASFIDRIEGRRFFDPSTPGKAWELDSSGWSLVPVVNDVGIEGGFRKVGIAGPPWIFHDPRKEKLYHLAAGDSRGLVEILIPDTAIHDAQVWDEETLLLATSRGLQLFKEGNLRPVPFRTPEVDIRRACRDGLGRVWMGGGGLWLTDGETLHDLDQVPMIGRSAVAALVPDPDRSDGVMVSLGARGVVVLRAVD